MRQITTQNALYYNATRTVGKIRVDVKVRLSDDCKNGFNEFAITGTIYERQPNGRWIITGGGCCHEEILRFFPKLKPFVNLHLSDAKGAPMYPDANGFYHLQNSGKDVVMRHLRISEEEFDQIATTASDQLCLKYLLYNMGVVARWEQEAKAAIATLETMTGMKFKDDSRRYQLAPLLPEEAELIESRMSAGHYEPHAIECRRVQAAEDKRRKQIQDLQAEAAKQIKKINAAITVKVYLLESGMSIDNFIYYDHINTGEFNWRDGYSTREKVTKEELDAFLARVDYSKLPEGIKFNLR